MEAVLKTSHYRNSRLIERLVANKFFWVVVVGFFFAYPMIRSMTRQLPPELPVYGIIPEYKFTDENGKAFGSSDLKGKIYIANFMFTSCKTACPLLLSKVQTVQHRLRGVVDRAAIVSFTVDPETDSSTVLYNKAREMKANPNVWRFVAAPMPETKKLLIEGFRVPVGEKTFANNIMDVAHSNKLVLIDQEGRIRGYYEAEKDGINQLMIDTGLLINRKKNS